MISEEIVHINGIPKKLIIFLHGYQDCAGHIDHKTTLLRNLPDIALHIPESPFISEVDNQTRQWFSIRQFDPNDTRRDTPSWEEFVELYNKMTVGLETAYQNIMEYIDNLLNEYQLSYSDLFLCGFSQGAMCAMYSGLMCPEKVGGVISFGGILAAQGYIENHYVSRPDVLLLHGELDEKIRIGALNFTVENLKKLGCKTQSYSFADTAHRITDEELTIAKDFITKHCL